MNQPNSTKNSIILFIAIIRLIASICSAGYRQETVFITMRDGVRLAADLYLPEGDARVPCVLIRTPYRKEGSKKECEWFAEKGIAVLCQDCRGKFSSEGEFYPFVNERQDGLETLRWIRKQPWSDGKIGGWGGSYVGYTQWAVSDSRDAMVPLLT